MHFFERGGGELVFGAGVGFDGVGEVEVFEEEEDAVGAGFFEPVFLGRGRCEFLWVGRGVLVVWERIFERVEWKESDELVLSMLYLYETSRWVLLEKKKLLVMF